MVEKSKINISVLTYDLGPFPASKHLTTGCNS